MQSLSLAPEETCFCSHRRNVSASSSEEIPARYDIDFTYLWAFSDHVGVDPVLEPPGDISIILAT